MALKDGIEHIEQQIETYNNEIDKAVLMIEGEKKLRERISSYESFRDDLIALKTILKTREIAKSE